MADDNGGGFVDRLEGVLAYESARVVRVKNWKLGFVFVLLTLIILAYVVIYSIIINKGYQLFDIPVGTVSIKVKGAVYIDGSSLENGNYTVYDAVDITYPPLERDACFVQTSFLGTYTQEAKVCPDYGTPSRCTSDADCIAGTSTFWGIKNGTCAPAAEAPDGHSYCYMQAWCPPEPYSETYFYNLYGVGKLTLQGKVRSYFPKFGVSVQETILTMGTQSFMSIEQIFDSFGETYTDGSEYMKYGSVILLSIDYDCDLNKPASKCTAGVKIIRVDGDEQATRGFNYRYYQYRGNDLQLRDLYKVNGLRFITVVGGRGGRFDVVTLLTNIGAGIGLLSIATVVTDLLMKKCASRKQLYTNSAVQLVHDQTEDPVLIEEKIRQIAKSIGGSGSSAGSSAGGDKNKDHASVHVELGSVGTSAGAAAPAPNGHHHHNDQHSDLHATATGAAAATRPVSVSTTASGGGGSFGHDLPPANTRRSGASVVSDILGGHQPTTRASSPSVSGRQPRRLLDAQNLNM